MAFRQIKTSNITDGAITSDKFPTEDKLLKITDISIANSTWHVQDDTAVNTGGGYIIITGENFTENLDVTIGDVFATSVTYVSNTELRVQVVQNYAGSYNVKLIDSDGQIANKINGLTYSEAPIWNTDSTLADQDTATPFSFTFDATNAICYQNTTPIPDGICFLSNGYLFGTVTTTPTVNYNFTIDAIDAENQDSCRNFTLKVRGLGVEGECQFDSYYNFYTPEELTLLCVSQYCNPVLSTLPGLQGTNFGCKYTYSNSCCVCTRTTFTVPNCVDFISVVAVGAGGGGHKSASTNCQNAGGGGGLVWANCIPVNPGDIITVEPGAAGIPLFSSNAYDKYCEGPNTGGAGGPSVVCLENCWYICATGGYGASTNDGTTGGGYGCVSLPVGVDYCINHGGNARNSIVTSGCYQLTGGGAAGYIGSGGTGICGVQGVPADGPPGCGGGGGAGGLSLYSYGAGPGGGVGLCGGNSNTSGGCANSSTTTSTDYSPGGLGGSGGQDAIDVASGVCWCYNFNNAYGGGAQMGMFDCYGSNGGSGAVRIIWGRGRNFPETYTWNSQPEWFTDTVLPVQVQNTNIEYNFCANGAICYVGTGIPSGTNLCSNGYYYGTITGLVTDCTYCYDVEAIDLVGRSKSKSFEMTVWTAAKGQCEYVAPANYSSTSGAQTLTTFTVPAGVTYISAVAIGGGGGGQRSSQGHISGGGGGLAWGSNLPVTPGDTVCVAIGSCGYGSSLSANPGIGGASYVCLTGCWCIVGCPGAKYTAGTHGYSGTGTFGGGNGGTGYSGGCNASYYPMGGGAGGYSGNGGNGFWTLYGSTNWGNAGTGGAGRSGAQIWYGYASFISGQGVSQIGCGCYPYGQCIDCFSLCYGGGASYTSFGAGGGRVRIIWGPGREYPAGAEDV